MIEFGCVSRKAKALESSGVPSSRNITTNADMNEVVAAEIAKQLAVVCKSIQSLHKKRDVEVRSFQNLFIHCSVRSFFHSFILSFIN